VDDRSSSSTVVASGATVVRAVALKPAASRTKKYLISSVSTLFDSKFCGQAPKVAKMLLHENHSLTCLTTLESKDLGSKQRKGPRKRKPSDLSTHPGSNPLVEIFLGSHSTLQNKRFAKRSITER
jgi:hypothetical protein